MTEVTRLGDQCSGHGCFPPRPNITASPDVFVNNKPVHRQGDAWAPHTCKSTHGGTLVSGSHNVFVNNKEIGRVGDPVSCGSTVMTGSSNVFAGS